MNWSWNSAFKDDSLFFQAFVVNGHKEKYTTVLAHKFLYSGIRHKKIIFDPKYLYLNYIKKGAMLRKLGLANNSFYYATSRKEFIMILKEYANKANFKIVNYVEYGDLTKYVNEIFLDEVRASEKKWFDYQSSDDPVIILFNNESAASLNLINEIQKKLFFSISVADSNSIDINNYFFPLYGNDDSALAINFYASFITSCIDRNTITDGGVKKSGKKTPFNNISGVNEEYIIKQILYKKKKLEWRTR